MVESASIVSIRADTATSTAPIPLSPEASPPPSFLATLRNLTPAEARVLKLISTGRLNKQIAGDLGISHKTVEKHRDKIYAKSGVTNTAMATHLAIYLGLTPVIRFPGVGIK